MNTARRGGRRALPALLAALILGACGTRQPDLTQTYVAALTFTPYRDPGSFLTATAAIGITRTAAAGLTATHIAILELTPSGDDFFLTTTATPSPTRWQLDPASLTPSWTPAPPSPSPTDRPAPDYSQCAWMWAYQPLPDLSAEITAALIAAGLVAAQAEAEAFGENCLPMNAPGAEPRFLVRETDFGLTLPVDDLDDEEALGDLLASALAVLADYPPGRTPGPNPGRITIIFTLDETQKRAEVGYNEGIAASQNTGGGAALIDAIGGLH